MDSVLQVTSKRGKTPGAWFEGPRNWRILDDRSFSTVQEGVTRDVDLGHAVANGAAPTFRLWENRQALVVSRHDMQLPHIARAVEHMEEAGWPVVTRETGGSAVPLGPGILNLSLVLPRSMVTGASGYSMDTVYRLLCDPIQQALATINIPTVFGSVPGAFCDGRFNLVAGGKKIAGTAQVSRANIAAKGTTREGYVLAHAALFVDIDTHKITEIVNRFYNIAGKAKRFNYQDITSVRHCIASNIYIENKICARTLADSVRTCILSIKSARKGTRKCGRC